MALVTRFEDLRAWQAARRLATVVYSGTRGREFSRDRSLTDQIRRAAISTVTNIAEGFASGSHVEFQRFLRYAVRSAAEVQACAYLAADLGYLGEGERAQLHEAADRVRALSSALIRRVAARPARQKVGADRIAEPETAWIVRARGLCKRPSRKALVGTSKRPHVHTSTRSE